MNDKVEYMRLSDSSLGFAGVGPVKMPTGILFPAVLIDEAGSRFYFP